MIGLLALGAAALTARADFFDDFEAYAAGSDLHGQGGWKGWDNTATAGALVSGDFAFSGTNSAKVIATSDLVHPYAGYTSGRWVYSFQQYIPSGSTGTSFVILLNQYNDGGPNNWSAQIQCNMDTGRIVSDQGGGATLSMIKDRWVEWRFEINLDANTVSEFYNGTLLSTHVWQSGGLNEIQAVDLYGNNAGPVYYDDISLLPALFDDFESYAAGSDLHGQGGWKGWDNTATAGALVSGDFAFSGTNSAKVIGTSDLVHPYAGVASGQWIYSFQQYIPSGATGVSFVILMNQYNDGGPYNWSVQIQCNMDTGQIISDHGGGATLAMVKDQWVAWRFEINLDAGVTNVSEYYNDTLLSTHIWRGETGLNELQAVDLYGNGASPVYYDDVSLAPAAGIPIPVVLAASHRGQPGKVWVTYNKPMDPASGTYALDGGVAVNTQEAGDTPNEVLLTTGAMTAGTTYTLTITDVEDTLDPPNLIAPNPTVKQFALAGQGGFTFCANFDDNQLPGGTAVYGTQEGTNTTAIPVVEDGVLKLTKNVNSQQGSWLINDIAGGAPVNHFSARFQLLIGGGSANPADGASFCWATNLPDASWGEEGVGTGLIVAFDNYDNGGGEAPAIDIKWNNVTVAHTVVPKQNSMSWLDIGIAVRPDGTDARLDLTVAGTNLYKDLVITGFTPLSAARFGFGARTGGLNANHWIDDVCINIYNEGDVVIVQQPQDTTVPEYGTAEFRVLADGSAPYSYQWYKGTAPIPGATGSFYVTPPNNGCEDGSAYQVVVSNPFSSVTSAVAVLHIDPRDTTLPTVLSVQSDNVTFEKVTVIFSEPVTEASAENLANYSFGAALTIVSAALQADGRTVVLTTAPQAGGTSYELQITGTPGIDDLACPTPNKVAAVTLPAFSTYEVHRGLVKREIWDGIGGTSVGDLTNNPAFPNSPTSTDYLTQAFSPDRAENYGIRMSGWLVPSKTGLYQLGVYSDDASLWLLSTNADPANLAEVARDDACCAIRDGALRTLVAGERYYFVAYMKEGGGGDYLRLLWKPVVQNPPSQWAYDIVPGANLMAAAPTAALSIDTQPAGTFGQLGVPFTLTIGVSASASPTFYQWQKQVGTEWVDIPGAAGPSFTGVSDFPGTFTYRCFVSVPGAEAVSATADVVIEPGNHVISRGLIKRDIWDGIGGTAINDLTNNAAYLANTPTSTDYLTWFLSPERGDNYGIRLSGYLVPDETGDYLFRTWSDDASLVFLSPSEDPAMAVKLVEETGCCTARDRTNAVHLEAGKYYAIRAFVKEGGGGDYLRLYWLNSTAPSPRAGYSIIDGRNLAIGASSAGVTLTVDDSAFAGQTYTVAEGDPGTALTVTASSSASPIVAFWQKNVGGEWVDVPLASGLSYTVESAVPYAGEYRCVVSVPGGTVTTASATVQVTPGGTTFSRGFLQRQIWDNIGGGVNISDLTSNPNFPNSPSSTDYLLRSLSPDRADNYGVRIRGYLVPSETADYTFRSYTDDAGVTYLSPTADPAQARKLVEELGCCNNLDTARAIPLVAGQRYAIISLMKEGGGGDTVQLYWKNNASIADFTIISGANLEVYAVVPGADITVVSEPADATVPENNPVTFTFGVEATSAPVFYQWSKDGTEIPGANFASYTISSVAAADAGQYQCVASIPGATATSRAATLTVSADVGPSMVSVGSLDGQVIGVLFSEAVTEATASVAANYALNGGAPGAGIASVLVVSPTKVALVLSTPVSGAFSVAASAIEDLLGNPNNSTAAGEVQAIFGENRDLGVEGNPLMPGVGFTFDSDFSDGLSVDVMAGGSDIWETADRGFFNITRRCGDFDMKVQVTRLDPVNRWAKAGLWAANSTDPASARIITVVTPFGTVTYPNQGDTGADGIDAGIRRSYGAGTDSWGGLGAPVLSAGINWLRLQRIGNHWIGQYSADGVNWVTHAETDQVFNPTMVVGLGTTSHNNNTNETTVANYQHFTIVPPTAPVIECGPITIQRNPDVPGTVIINWDPCCSLQATDALNSDPSQTQWVDVPNPPPLIAPVPYDPDGGGPIPPYPMLFLRAVAP